MLLEKNKQKPTPLNYAQELKNKQNEIEIKNNKKSIKKPQNKEFYKNYIIIVIYIYFIIH